MTSNEAIAFLEKLTVGDKNSPGTLRHLAYVAGEEIFKEAKSAVKDKLVVLLSRFFCAPGRFESIWNALTAADRAMVSFHIWGNGREPIDCARQIAQKFGVPDTTERRLYWYSKVGLSYYKQRYCDIKSKLWLLFPENGEIETIFDDEIRAAVGEMKRVYKEVPSDFIFTSREDRAADFGNIVRFCNANKLSLTKGGLLNKSSAMKLQNYCGYDELAADIGARPEDMRTADGLLVTFPLTTLCMTGGLLSVSESVCAPGSKAVVMLGLSHAQLVKKLFDAYLKSKSFDEISIMRGIKAKRGHNPCDARRNIAKELSYCTPGRAVFTPEFERHLRIASDNFARKDEKYVIETGSNYYDYGVEWDAYEHPLIKIILTFFGALGILDIAWGENSGGFTDSGKRAPVAFRINPLGAYVLGMSDNYEASESPEIKPAGGFTLLPDYTIIIPESRERLKHEMFFERHFTKVSVTNEAAIYKLDFETVARALDSGLGVKELRRYLSASDKPIPENIARALDDWQKQSERVKIRHVTLIECDDEALLEEIIRYKGMGELVQGKLSPSVVVRDGSTPKIKKLIEKNRRFCKDVL